MNEKNTNAATTANTDNVTIGNTTNNETLAKWSTPNLMRRKNTEHDNVIHTDHSSVE